MVSGFLTSPLDQERIDSAVASPIRSWSKLLTSSTARSSSRHLDVEAQRLHLLDEHLEALGDARLGDVLPLDDGLVDLDAAQDIVGLDGEQFLERVGGPVRF